MLRKFTISVAVVLFFSVALASYASAVELPAVTRGSYLASISKVWLDKALNYSNSGDYAALQKLLDAKMVFFLKSGLKVFIVDYKTYRDKIKIRAAGSTNEVWTSYNAVAWD